ncbi:hypothetical protein BD324DRAFT_619232 [Kockovaella imperatae]|uniref:DUF1365-domain-containing protein n=1 Tax=Kockovaella imperatae TaxID=4999 RepID=A0A1Y1UMM8_9TREE|nr:hypothetical protein BD324DRAFT_619232 [Kockovaella imperatae]ORX39313.1 hypothetical protein BD324DRAFT_619232 [Kockovaella imperatae]
MNSTTMALSFWLMAALAAAVSYYCFTPVPKNRRLPIPKSQHLPSAVIPSYTSHARLLPKPARHAFSYSLIYLGLDVDALDSGALDLPNRLLVYGGSPWTKILGLRSDGYLVPGQGSFRSKLDALLIGNGIDKEHIGKAWLLTMPSFLGFEGINPLSVWYVYDRQGGLLCCVLEVHNTFEEKHAYVLMTDSEFRHDPKPGHHFAWTFPRTFHVSPFNSRNGYYRLDLVDPFPKDVIPSDHPHMKISLRLLTPDRETKLTAILASDPMHPSVPLDYEHIGHIVRCLIRWPLALFLSTPRILFHAWILHYEKKLAVFPRPEPRMSGQDGVWNPPQNYSDTVGKPVRWQPTGLTEKMARSIVSAWAKSRALETSIQLEIRNHGSDSSAVFPTTTGHDSFSKLVITTSCPKIFSHLVICPSPDHFLILAPEILTSISDPALFRHFFNASPSTVPNPILDRRIQAQQRDYFIWMSSCSNIAPTPDLVRSPERHFTSSGLSISHKVGVIFVVWSAFVADWLEEGIMGLMKARWVPGGDPQRIWERAFRRLYIQYGGGFLAKQSEGWEEVGSLLYN